MTIPTCHHPALTAVEGERPSCDLCGQTLTDQEVLASLQQFGALVKVQCQHRAFDGGVNSPKCRDCGATVFVNQVESITLSEGVKNDFADGKTQRYDLIAPGPLDDLAKLLGYGAEKYSARNWELGFAWSRAYNALIRHLQAFWGGEVNDPDTGLPHMAAVMCNAMFLAEFTITHPELDDRPVS